MGGMCEQHKLIEKNGKTMCEFCSKELVVIEKSKYNYLEKQSEKLDFLEMRGVDNWIGYRTPPEREDYDTEEEYKEAFEKALED